MFTVFLNWLNGPSCQVYTACKMTGRNKHDMVERAKFVSSVLAKQGVKCISPVLEEAVEDSNTKLINNDKERLAMYWKRDKHIIRRLAHVVLIDQAENKSFGVEREYMLSRGVLWKPTCLVFSQDIALSIVQFEDDAYFTSIHVAAAYIAQTWGSRRKRWLWRAKMLNRTVIPWIINQCYAWR